MINRVNPPSVESPEAVRDYLWNMVEERKRIQAGDDNRFFEAYRLVAELNLLAAHYPELSFDDASRENIKKHSGLIRALTIS